MYGSYSVQHFKCFMVALPVGHVVKPLVDEGRGDLLLQGSHPREFLRNGDEHADIPGVGQLQYVAVELVVGRRQVTSFVLHHGNTNLLFLIDAELPVVRQFFRELLLPRTCVCRGSENIT